MDPTFTVYTTCDEGHVVLLSEQVSLITAAILSGMERDEFYAAIINNGWVGTSPAWAQFRPLVIVQHGHLLKHEQFSYLIELV